MKFGSRVAAVLDDIPSLGDHQIVVRLAELAAAIGDGHTRLTLPRLQPEVGLDFTHGSTPAPRDAALAFDRLPVEIGAFADGRSSLATDSHADLLGARLLRIGDVPNESKFNRDASVTE